MPEVLGAPTRGRPHDGLRRRSVAWSLLVVALLPVLRSPLCAQSVAVATKAPTSLLADVVQFRMGWIERDTPLDRCSFYRAMADPADFPEGLPRWMRQLVGSDSLAPCAVDNSSRNPPSGRASADGVVIDSVSIRGADATVFMTIQRGENRHHEDYSVVLRGPERGWATREVRVWGATREFLSGAGPP